ncbi:MAG: thioesterase family protein [Pseudolysinimonas sp.]
MTSAAYYDRVAEHRYLPTEYAGGAWSPEELHFAPLGGLLVHAIDLHRAAAGSPPLALGRVSFDILGFLATSECEIAVETVRPGRTIELVEATATIAGRTAVRARAWFLADFDTASVAGGAPEPMPAPGPSTGWSMTDKWTGGFVNSLDVRPVSQPQPGRTAAWLHSDYDLVAGEAVSAHASFLSLVDTANGIAVREDPQVWAFPNVDLTIHLYRQPVGRPVGLDTTQIYGTTGQGLTATVLHDTEGAVGVAHQLLTIRELGA